MLIPEEQLVKYNISIDFEEEDTYRTYLIATDFEIIKGFETLLAEPTKFLSNLVSLAKTLKSVMQYRTIAREEINRIEEENGNIINS